MKFYTKFEGKVRKRLWSKKLRQDRGWIFAVPMLVLMGYPLEISILFLTAAIVAIGLR